MLHSQNAGLRPAMLALTVSVRRGNLFCLDFTDDFLFTKILFMHCLYFEDSWQVVKLPGQNSIQVTSDGKDGRALCYKTFMTENPGFLPGFRIFPDYFLIQTCGISCRFWKTKHFKNLLRIVGGDSKDTNLFSNTHNFGNLLGRRPAGPLFFLHKWPLFAQGSFGSTPREVANSF